MTTVETVEAKRHFSELIERVAGGEEIVITRGGDEVARLMPPRALPPRVLDALGQAHAMATRIRRSHAVQVPDCEVSIRTMIEEGRR